jgi:hypothetical protein
MNFAHFCEGFSDSLFPSFPSVPSFRLRQISPEPEDLRIEPMNPEPDPPLIPSPRLREEG